MKKLFPKALLLSLIAVLASCSTYQYSSRSVKVNRKDLQTKPQAVEIVVDYSRTVTATSSYCLTKKDAIAEAEQNCILKEKIDVVVDPIFQFEFSPYHLKTKWKATVIGYVGMYRNAPTGVDAVKGHDMEDVEKYKLLTDSEFPMYYYSKGTGDTYYINTNQAQEQSVSVKPGTEEPAARIKKQPKKRVKLFDLFKKSGNF